MAGDEELSEAYIAELLKKDAQKVSANYARSGIYDVLPKRPTGTAPKPNTRFLQNIIRSTDSHNAALKQKELGDAASRLRALARKQDDERHGHSRYQDTAERDRERDHGWHKRKREHLNDELDDYRDSERAHRSSKRHSPERSTIHSSRHGSQERRHSRHHRRRKDRIGDYNHRGEDPHDSDASGTDSGPEKHSSKSRKRDSRRDHRNDEHDSKSIPSSRTRKTSRDRNQSRRKHRSYNESASPDDKHRHSRSHRKHRSSTNRSPSREPSDTEHNTTCRTNGSHQSTKRHSHSPSAKDTHSRAKHKRRSTPSPSSPPPDEAQDTNLSDDPLTPFLGPLPATRDPIVRVRGRGATSAHSGTNTRLSASYDPSADVVLDEPNEGEDWDQALEALRDRQRFRQVGIDRLLAAGFSKDEVARMERGGEKDETDVKWSKKGQAREWDRGKVLDEDGNVSFAANRLSSEL